MEDKIVEQITNRKEKEMKERMDTRDMKKQEAPSGEEAETLFMVEEIEAV